MQNEKHICVMKADVPIGETSWIQGLLSFDLKSFLSFFFNGKVNIATQFVST